MHNIRSDAYTTCDIRAQYNYSLSFRHANPRLSVTLIHCAMYSTSPLRISARVYKHMHLPCYKQCFALCDHKGCLHSQYGAAANGWTNAGCTRSKGHPAPHERYIVATSRVDLNGCKSPLPITSRAGLQARAQRAVSAITVLWSGTRPLGRLKPLLEKLEKLH